MQRFSKGFIYFYNLGTYERVKIFLYNGCRLSETMRHLENGVCVCLLLRLQFDHSSINVWNLLQIREVLVVTLVEGKHGIQYRPNQVSPLTRSEANKPNRARPRNLDYQVTVRAIHEKSSCTLFTMRSPSMSKCCSMIEINNNPSIFWNL